ncbi:hypothetical protein TL16_g07924 [Triparma laevis f. inornata]|uniref:CRAL-TRIO domain-containing protein n=1 Tax=Triparma laevis f. inornata TaxID=1714386 RepID=A0A9W7AVW1_9STRA|nr:hypothetical protein TL16_g07924 [Triparma laevis f. inornata]
MTPEELSACTQVAQKLRVDGLQLNQLCPRCIAITTINKKLRVDDAVDSYKTFMKAISDFSINSFSDIYANFSDFDTIISPRLISYNVCGLDSLGRQIFWINGKNPVTVEEERDAVRAGWFWFCAIHSDNVSLRQGVTFVIDVSSSTEKIGNEKKMQKTWQSYPLRPQRILIMGAGYLKRLFINGLVSFAALFSKNKVLERIRFATVEEVTKECGATNVPSYISGVGVGKEGDVAAWVKMRFDNFPEPKLW